MDLALNNLQWFMCHKSKPNNLQIYGITYSYQILIIFKLIYLTHRGDPDEYNQFGQSRPGSNDYEGVDYLDLKNGSLTIHYHT